MQFLDTITYLPDDILTKVDRASMAHSLEVRVPLVDASLLADLAALLVKPPPDGKHLLAASPARALPEAVTERAKSGFETPVGAWLMDGLRQSSLPPLLQRPGVHWSRRWAYLIACEFGIVEAQPRVAEPLLTS